MRCDVFEQPNWDGILTQSFDVIIHVDFSLLDLEPFLFEFFSHIGIRHRSIQRVLLSNFPADGNLHPFQQLLQFFSVSLLLGFFPEQ